MYVCPKDDGSLIPASDGLTCTVCGSSYATDAFGLTLLDVVQNPEAHAFDEQHTAYDVMSGAEVESSTRLGRRFLDIVEAKAGRLGRAGMAVLDVGCGKGELTIGLAMDDRLRGSKIYAFDHSILSLQALARTADKLEVRDRIEISQQDIDAMAFPNACFDVVFGNAVLHHFVDWRGFLRGVAPKKPDTDRYLAAPF